MVLATRRALQLPPFPFSDQHFLEGLVFYTPLWHEKCRNSPFPSFDRNHHVCTVTGAAWGSTGYTFDGTDDSLSIPHNAIFNFNALPMSFGGWFNFPTTPVDSDKFISKGTEGTDGFHFTYIDGSGYRFFYGGSGSIIVQATINLNTWYCMFATTTGGASGTTAYTYVNGVQDNSGTAKCGGNNTDDLYLARHSNAANEYGNSITGEFWTYKRVLSAGEISYMYQRTKWRYQ